MENHPADYAKAIAFEKEIRMKDPNVMLRDGDNGSEGDCMSGMCYV